MNLEFRRKILHPAITLSLVLVVTLMFLIIMKLTGMRNLEFGHERQNFTLSYNERSLLAETVLLTGIYTGTIVITEPLALGVMDFVVDIADENGVLTGSVNSTQTQALPGTPELQGNIITPTNGITPTFVMNSNRFSGTISGRKVVRSFTLEGEVLQNGEVLQGTYHEVIEAFTPRPLHVRGTFLLASPVQAPLTNESVTETLVVTPTLPPPEPHQ